MSEAADKSAKDKEREAVPAELVGLPNPFLSAGTQVVVNITAPEAAELPLEIVAFNGAVGVIVAASADPLGTYGVRFPDGRAAEFYRRQLSVRKHFQLAEAAEQPDFYQYVIYRCVVGSRAFGLDSASSDTDRRGFYLPTADLQWSFDGVPEQLENKATEECYWELQKFMTMALKANPNVLECLYTPMVELATPLAQELLDRRAIFVSKLVYQTYNGYVISQFKKLEQDIRTHGEIRWKHAMHLIRLLFSGIGVLKTGAVPVWVSGEQRDLLLQIKAGQLKWSEIDRLRLELHKEFDTAFAETSLPDRPDYAAANAFLLRARRAML